MKKWMLILCALLLVLLLTGCSCKHEETTIINAKDPACEEAGYTGDTKCLQCEEIVAQGTEIEPIGHSASERLYALEATCKAPGYTGDIYCTRCQAVLETGEETALGDHLPGASFEEEPTCEEDGWYSRVNCSVCGEVLREEQTLDALGHKLMEMYDRIEPTCTEWGHEGWSCCEVCSKDVVGDYIPRIPHTFENRICTMCGNEEPGLFDENGELLMSWNNLVEQSLLTFYEDTTCVIGVSSELNGVLVLPYDANINLYHDYESVNLGEPCNLTGIYFSKGITELERGCLVFVSSIENVTIAGPVTLIPRDAFAECTNLKSITLPDSVETLELGALRFNPALEHIDLPDSLVTIKDLVFQGCTNLKEITLPASLKNLGHEVFEDCTSIERIEVKCALEYVNGVSFPFKSLPNLKQLIISDAWNQKNFSMFHYTIREQQFSILYRGTEDQWNTIEGSKYFPNATVTFNYTGE